MSRAPFVSDPDFTLYVGDVREVLAALPDGSVDCVVTSPPYWGLRDYGTGHWAGGNPDCDHVQRVGGKQALAGANTLGRDASHPNRETLPSTGHALIETRYRDVCGKCGASRVDQQIGLEATPELFVQEMVAVFREVRRVLAPHGTLWLNLGDSYGGGSLGRNDAGRNFTGGGGNREGSGNPGRQGVVDITTGLKPKDLVGIPWRVAFALQADGWYLRADIVWSKANPMPESVTDRPTKSHEYVFMLAKGQWKSRVVALADLHSELVHLREHVGPKDANVWAHEFGVRLATAILDCAEREQQFSLPPLDSQVWQKLPDDRGGFSVAGLPVEHRAAAFASRLLSANISAKEFLCEFERLGVTLTDRHHFKVGGGPTEFALPRGVDRYGETSVAIHDAGEVGELDFASHTLKFSRPVGCSYFFDQEAVRESNAESTIRIHGPLAERRARHKHIAEGKRQQGGNLDVNGGDRSISGRNVRSVWEIATQPYPDAHFATFPEALPDRCIRAGCPERVCRTCGKPSERIVGRELVATRGKVGAHNGEGPRADPSRMDAGTAWNHSGGVYGRYETETLGWSDCGHGNYRTGVVLDPFMGSGTTALVARRLGRRSIGVELNEAYAALCARRLQQLSLFAEEQTA